MVYPSCCLVTTYRNVTSTEPHDLEFTEECLTVFLDLFPCTVMRLFLVK